jgi:hypothetical protein
VLCYHSLGNMASSLGNCSELGIKDSFAVDDSLVMKQVPLYNVLDKFHTQVGHASTGL